MLALLVAYAAPPLAGLSFLVFVLRLYTPEQVKTLLFSSPLPFYIVGTTVGGVYYFLWFLRPALRFADGQGSADEALARIKSFARHYWVLYLLRHFIGALILLLSSSTVLGIDLTFNSFLRMVTLGVMLSCVTGLPSYTYIIDRFAPTFSELTLTTPVFRLSTRVFWIAVVIPVLLNTAVLLFLASRLGGLSLGLVALWCGLTIFALTTARSLMSSLNRSVRELGLATHRDASAQNLHPEELRLRSLDELGVLTGQYRELLGDLKQQARLLDLRNQVLRASRYDVPSEQVYRRLAEIVSQLFCSERARLIVVNPRAKTVDVLATIGTLADGSPGAQPISAEAVELLSLPSSRFVPATELQSVLLSASGIAAVVPLHEAATTREQLAVVALLDDAADVERCDLEMFELIREDISAAVRGTRLEREKTQLEQVLLESQRMEMVGRLAAGVAHDFNNILTVILNSAVLLQLESKGEQVATSVVNEYAQLIVESSERARVLTGQLLTFSKQNIGLATVFEINSLAEGLDAFLRRLLPEDIRFELQLNAQDDLIKADPGHIEQVLTNLVVNARDAMKDGGELGIETLNEEDSILIRVTDTGAGMTPEVMSHLFEPFFTTKSKDRGTGLGLATVYGIVTGYSGHIEVESTIGEGTTMTVSFPLSSESCAPKEPIEEPAGHTPAEATILLVEDEESLRRVLGDILSRHGYNVLLARNGEEALDVLETTSLPIDVLSSTLSCSAPRGRRSRFLPRQAARISRCS